MTDVMLSLLEFSRTMTAFTTLQSSTILVYYLQEINL